MSSRRRRAERLVEVGREALNVARARVTAAARAVADARADADSQERAWLDGAQKFATQVARASDLDEQSAHLRTLRHRADTEARRLERALAEERHCAAAVVQAAMEHRKMELWRDRIAQGEFEEERRLEQRGSDELAARAARVRA